MTTPSGILQLKIRLEVVPEEPAYGALANKIASEIYDDLKAQGYNVEPHYTGEAGAGHDFLIWLQQAIASGGQVLMAAAMTEIANQTVGVFKQIASKMKKSQHKNLPSSVTVQLPDGSEKKADGSLASTLAELITLMENDAQPVITPEDGQGTTETTVSIKKQSVLIDDEQVTTETTEEITMSIKFFQSQKRKNL